MSVTLKEAHRGQDDGKVWQVLQPAVEAGDTFCAPPDGGKAGGLRYFWPEGARVWLAYQGETLLGCTYLRANQTGNGSHVCNAGYCTLPEARGKGVARAMLAFSLQEARNAGFRAMQYNFVVSTNTRAVETWQRAGFEIVGRLPGAFRHPKLGYVDALVMYRSLVEQSG